MMRSSLFSLALLVFALGTVSAQDFDAIWTVPFLASPIPLTPVDVDVVDDLDGDGVADLVVGLVNLPNYSFAGRIEFRSGATGALISTILAPPMAGTVFGQEVLTIDDLNGDGVREVAVGDVVLQTATNQFVVQAWIHDPVTGLLLQTETSLTGGFGLPALRLLADPDGDGVRSVALGGSFIGGNVASRGVTVVDPAGLTLPIFVLAVDQFGVNNLTSGATSLVSVGDRDGDGFDDHVIATAQLPPATLLARRFDLISGFDFSEIGPALGSVPGPVVAPFGMRTVDDQDGDGLPEIVLADFFWRRWAVYSVGQPEPLFFRTLGAGQSASLDARGLGDCDGDGRADIGVADGNLTDALIHTTRQRRGIETSYPPPSNGLNARFLHAFDDLTGDGLAESILGVGNELRLVSFAGTRTYGGPQTLSLDWRPFGIPGATVGAVESFGAPANAAGVLGVSLAPFNGLIAGEPLLINPIFGSLVLTEPITFDAQGAFGFGLNLAQTALVDIPLHLQALAVDSAGVVQVSNGLTVEFIPGRLGVMAITPRGVAGGETVTVSGAGFEPGVVVRINGVATPTTFVDADTLTFVAPANPAYVASLTVQNPGGESSAPTSFNPVPLLLTPTPLSVDAASGFFFIIGGPFLAGTTVTVNGQTIAATFGVTDTRADFNLGPQTPGTSAVATIQVPGGPNGAGTTFTLTLNFQ